MTGQIGRREQQVADLSGNHIACPLRPRRRRDFARFLGDFVHHGDWDCQSNPTLEARF